MDDLDQLARRINRSSLVLVLGRSDTGKTTVVRYLHERLGGDVIDADLGQASIGPPAVICVGTFTNGAQAGYFVGDISPAGHFLQVLTGCHRMAMKARRPCVIDTDGYIDDGAARAVKSELINLIRPDLIVLLQRAHELDYYKMFERKGITVIEHPVRHSESRTREHRIETREERFRHYFSQAGLQRWKLREIAFECSELGDGEPLDTTTLKKSLRCEVTAGWKTGRKATVVVNGMATGVQAAKGILGVDQLKIFQHPTLENLLLGCLVGDEFRGLGILKSITQDVVQVLSPVSEATILQMGSLRVREDGRHMKIPRGNL